MNENLGVFEGLPVVGCGIEIPSAGGGLRDALTVDPVVAKQGQRMQVVLDCTVAKVRHEPAKGEEPNGEQIRVHVLSVDGATIADDDAIRKLLLAQHERILLAKEEAEGVQRLALEAEQVAEEEALSANDAALEPVGDEAVDPDAYSKKLREAIAEPVHTS